MPRSPLLVVLLAACGESAEPAAEAPAPPAEDLAVVDATSPQPARAAPIRDEETLLWELVLKLPDESATGLRVFADGAVEQAVGTTELLPWREVRRLGPDELAELRGALASPELAAVPDDLPVTPQSPQGGPRGTYRMRVDGAWRRVRSDGYLGVRVPAFDGIEHLLRGGSKAPPVHTRWRVVTEKRDLSHDVPCDPLRQPALGPIAAKLLDPGLPEAPAEADGLILAHVDWGTGTRIWQTTLHEGGLVVRVDEQGEVRRVLLSPVEVEVVTAMLAQVDWVEAHAACGR